MNKYLEKFFEDELKHNDYYEGIRSFAKNKKLDFVDVISPVVNNYESNIDNFGPYRFVDAIEDFINDDSTDLTKYADLDDLIDDMWEKDYFENY